jgi:hypothetical protein
MTTSIKHVVEQYYEAWKTGDTRKFLFALDFTFDGPILSFASPEPFFEMARQNFPLVKDVKLLETIYSESQLPTVPKRNGGLVGDGSTSASPVD